MSRHLIYKQKVVLHVSHEQDTLGLQKKVSDLFKYELSDHLQQMLDELFPDETVTRIDSLQLDLGKITTQNFENEFKAAFLGSLKENLQASKDDALTRPDESVKSSVRYNLDTFLYFLEHGSLPWYSTKLNISNWEQQLLKEFSDQEYKAVLNWLRDKSAVNATVIERLVRQFSKSLPEALLFALRADLRPKWPELFNDFQIILNYFYKKPEQAVIHFWQVTFQQLLQVPHQSEGFEFEVLKDCVRYADKSNLGEIRAADIELIRSGLKTAEVLTAFNQAINDPQLINRDAEANRTVKTRDRKSGNLGSAEPLYVNNSGIVLLHPFLQSYFTGLKLYGDNGFIDQPRRERAVLLLHYLATSETEAAEFDLILEKILCGLGLEDTLPVALDLTEEEKIESDKLLEAVISYWEPLKNTSIAGLQNTFLQREGRLELKDNGWLLTVEQKTVDILLGKLPWGFGTIRLPWMQEILSVDWC